MKKEEISTDFFKVDWSNRSKLRGFGEKSLGNLLLKLRNILSPKAKGISVVYFDDCAMKKINKRYRNINKTTDVLSFPADPENGAFYYLGDIIISLQVAEKVANKLGITRRREVESLIIHGFLHLCQYDHEVDNGEMMEMQAKLERELLGSDFLPMTTKYVRNSRNNFNNPKGLSDKVANDRDSNRITKKEDINHVNKIQKIVAKNTLKPLTAAVRCLIRRRRIVSIRNCIFG